MSLPLPKQYYIFIILLFAILFNSFYNYNLPLHIDEAYYWVWSQKLELSYFDHPPMVAYFIKIFTTIFNSNSEFAIKFVSVFCMSVSLLYIYKLTLEITSNMDTALFSALIFLTIPLTQIGYIVVTPDAPLILFWTLSAYYSYKAIFYKNLKYFIFAGLSIGFMMLSKYTSVLFILSLLIYLIICEKKIFLEKKFWLALVLAVITLFPVLYWNYKHEWISFLFQYNHGSSETTKLNLDKFIEFLGGNFLIFTPIFLIFLLIAQVKEKLFIKDKKLFFINALFIIPFLFFMYKGLFKKMELNWIAPAYISGAIICGYYMQKLNYKKWLIFGLIFATIVSSLLRFPEFFHLPSNANIKSRIYGYKELANYISNEAKSDEQIYADHLTMASILKYYIPNHPDILIPTYTKFSQYNLWNMTKKGTKKKGIYISKYESLNQLKKVFKKAELFNIFQVQNKYLKSKKFYIYRVED